MRTTPAKSLKSEQWPAPDRLAWKQAIRSGGLFDDAGPAAHWAPATRRTVEYDYGIWLMWCRQQGLLEAHRPEERLSPAHVEHYVTDLQDRVSPVTVHNYVSSLFRMMTVLCPDGDWSWLRELVNRLARLAKPDNDKRGRLQDSGALTELGHQLMRSAGEITDGQSQRERLAAAVQYRDGLMIALLAARPLRRSNFAAIELERHLYRQDHNWLLHFRPEETKQRQPIELSIPVTLTDSLDFYLESVRPCFPGALAHQRLWASAKGVPLTGEGCYQRIIKRTRQAFDRSINPHLFRDCAATTIARHTPEHVGIASQLLGHSRLDTTERHYNQAGSVSASHAYQAALAQIKGGKRR